MHSRLLMYNGVLSLNVRLDFICSVCKDNKRAKVDANNAYNLLQAAQIYCKCFSLSKNFEILSLTYPKLQRDLEFATYLSCRWALVGTVLTEVSMLHATEPTF